AGPAPRGEFTGPPARAEDHRAGSAPAARAKMKNKDDTSLFLIEISGMGLFPFSRRVNVCERIGSVRSAGGRLAGAGEKSNRMAVAIPWRVARGARGPEPRDSRSTRHDALQYHRGSVPVCSANRSGRERRCTTG